jgi:hypothetical protein
VFKNKGFLYGLGLGLILGASLLQLMNFAVLDNKELTNDIQSSSPSISPSLEPVISVKPITTVKPIETASTPETPSTSAIVTPVITKTEEPASPSPAATMAIAKQPSGKIVLIEKGMTSSDVASLLFNKGIIADQKSFDASLGELKLDRIIRIGSYTFLPNEKDADIINKITTHK